MYRPCVPSAISSSNIENGRSRETGGSVLCQRMKRSRKLDDGNAVAAVATVCCFNLSIYAELAIVSFPIS